MNRSSPPKGSAPRITKPVHVRGESLAEAPAASSSSGLTGGLRDDDGAPARMPVNTASRAVIRKEFRVFLRQSSKDVYNRCP